MSMKFKSECITVNGHDLFLVPLEISERLPSRGMVMVAGLLDGQKFTVALEPDGKFGHWFELESYLLKSVDFSSEHSFVFEPIDEWPEPVVPVDVLLALEDAGVLSQWNDVSVKAKWDWLRWIGFTKNSETRLRRVEIMASKLKNGDKRPCCFDRTRCTVMDVSKSGRLDLNV